jgi:hypothetical protein
MNDETLEQKLRELPAPELPGTGCAEILSKALREARVASQQRQTWPTLLVYLQSFFQRNPLTTSAMTALWVLIFVFRISTPVDPQEKMFLAHFDPNRPVHLVSISNQILLVQLLREEPEHEQRQIP